MSANGLVVLIMKWVVVCAVAVCVAAAEVPCEEYCAYNLIGVRNIEHQPNCDCASRGGKPKEQLEGSSIYYEPAEYLPLPALIYERPFYIINPYAAIQKNGFNDITTRTSIPYPPYQVPNTQIEINMENMPHSHRRKEKNIDTNDRKHTSLYLDIDVDPEGDVERSASNTIITIDDLKLTEESLIECANLHTVLDYRKERDANPVSTRSPGPFGVYEHLSDEELMNRINDKCSQISDIVEKSLNEIKEKRPKKITYRMQDEKQETNKQEFSHEHIKKEHVDITAEETVQVTSEENVSDFDDDTQKNENIVVIYTDNGSDENTTENHTLSPILTSKTKTSPINHDVISTTMYSSDKISSHKDLDALITTTKSLSVTDPTAIPTYSANEFAFDTETTPLLTAAATSPSTMTNTNSIDQDVAQNHQFNKVIKSLDTKLEFNKRRDEKDVPLSNIIHEFNNSVESYNGTEETPNKDFGDGIIMDTNSSNTLVTEESKNDAVNIPSEIVGERIEQVSINATADTTTESIGPEIKPDHSPISGNLYFLYNQHHIPAKFVQKPTGSLQLGIDAATLCDRLTEHDKVKSALINTLCECYKSDKCTRK